MHRLILHKPEGGCVICRFLRWPQARYASECGSRALTEWLTYLTRIGNCDHAASFSAHAGWRPCCLCYEYRRSTALIIMFMSFIAFAQIISRVFTTAEAEFALFLISTSILDRHCDVHVHHWTVIAYLHLIAVTEGSTCDALSLPLDVKHGLMGNDKRRLCTVLSSARYRMPHGCTYVSAAVDATIIQVVISVALRDRNKGRVPDR